MQPPPPNIDVGHRGGGGELITCDLSALLMARPLTSVAFAHPKTATPPPPLLSSIGQAATDSDDALAGRDDLLYRLDPHRQVPPRLVQAPTRAHLRRASTKVASATVRAPSRTRYASSSHTPCASLPQKSMLR